jgi:uncharacterized protein (DUF58 family)
LTRLAVSLARPAPAPSLAGDGSLPAAAPLPRDARVVLFGDFLAPLDAIRRVIARLAATGVRGHLVQIVDPAEETMPFAGRVEFAGCEAEGAVLFGRVEAVRDAYVARFQAHRDGLGSIARGFGWTLQVHHADQPPAAALLALFAALAEPRRR